MLNERMSSKNISKVWRKAKVIALLKPSKDPGSPKTYRPISFLCHTYKLFGRIILKRQTASIDAKLIPEQAGFRRGMYCTSQLLIETQFIEDDLRRMISQVIEPSAA